MKKRTLAAVALCALLLFSGCKRSNITVNIGPVLDDFRYEPQEQPKEVRQVEIVTLEDANFGAQLGFAVKGLPQTETLASYKYFVLEGWYAQVEFATADEGALALRVARADQLPLSGTYTENHRHIQDPLMIDDIDVKVRTSKEGCALVTWTRGDYQYALHSSHLRGVPAADVIEDVVRGAYAEQAG